MLWNETAFPLIIIIIIKYSALSQDATDVLNYAYLQYTVVTLYLIFKSII